VWVLKKPFRIWSAVTGHRFRIFGIY